MFYFIIIIILKFIYFFNGKIGFGVSKFFDYVKYMIVSLLIVTAISGVYTYAS